jgi:hypothetical protein
VPHEAEAELAHGPDQHLGAAIVSDHLAGGLDTARDRGLGHDPAIPDAVHDLGSCHQATAVLEQQPEQREDLRLDGNHCAAGSQLAGLGVEAAIPEAVDHRRRRV